MLAALLACAQTQAGTITTQIDGVDDPLKTAIAAAAEITQYGKQDISAAQAQRLYKNAGEQIVKALEAYGYYNARTDGELKETAQGWTAILHVRAGERLQVGDFSVAVPSPAREEKEVAAALANFTPKSGQPFDSTAYEKSKAAVQSALFSVGYLDAKQIEHKVEVSRDANRAAIALKWDVGERYRFGEVIFKGSQLNDGVLDRYIPWHEGDFYSQTQLLRLQQKLVDADYFAIVDVQPDKDKASGGVIPVNITLAPAPRNIYTAGIFVDSDIGPGIKGSITRRWVNMRGHKAKVEVEIAQREKMLAGTYTIPLPGNSNRAYNFGVAYRNIDTATAQSDTLRLTANETRLWHGWNRTLGINALSGTYTVANIDGNSTLVYPEVSLERKRADDMSFVRDGYSLNLDARASPGPSTRFVQARADAKWIRGFGERQRLIVRGALGASAVNDFDKLPPELRFFGGGDRSIRGYAYQTVGPPLPANLLPIALAKCAAGRSTTDCNNLIVGGKSLAVASAEYEYYFTPNWGIGTFVDAGDAFSAFGDFKTHIGTGFGLRWRSPVGMVRADLGFPVNDPEGRHGVQLHLIIGPDL
ncbi:MAG: outer membrane protein assembly factor [Proteobacteria bacterium]|nr:outer membrane protein assembly factor [Pseudomonadota bacterium]